MGPGTVEVQTSNIKLRAQSRTGCSQGERRAAVPPRSGSCASSRDICAATSTWCAPDDGPEGLILGHEITGEVIEKGRDVEFINEGDLSRPRSTSPAGVAALQGARDGICLTVNPGRPGGRTGYVDMGGWPGGQAQFVMVPYATSTA